ncbi:MAG TPA: hypothetical protein VLU73_10415 [Methylococcaceae bacterium]|jgi:hypothetical protein|nr:hypothetical protein [Methylococcaceae bacterium]
MTQTKKISNRVLIVIIGLVCIGLIGCSKIDKENYDKLKVGMGYDEVVQLLGDPAQCESVVGVKSCTWGEPPKTITIRLIADKVVLFQSEGL